MTEQTVIDVNSLFGDYEVNGRGKIYQFKKGRHVLALLPPLEYKGSLKYSLPVETFFKGKKAAFPSYLYRVIVIPEGKFGLEMDKAFVTGAVINQTLTTKIAATFKTSDSDLVAKTELALNDSSECHLMIFMKGEAATDKLEISFTVKKLRIPTEIYQDADLDWETLLEDYQAYVDNFNKNDKPEKQTAEQELDKLFNSK